MNNNADYQKAMKEIEALQKQADKITGKTTTTSGGGGGGGRSSGGGGTKKDPFLEKLAKYKSEYARFQKWVNSGDAIIQKAEKAGMSLTDYIVASSLLTEIHVAEDTRPLVTELKRIGNNLNQISMKINAGAFQSYNFQEVIELQKNIYEELYRISRGGDAVSQL